jgi:hypothetical protein
MLACSAVTTHQVQGWKRIPLFQRHWNLSLSPILISTTDRIDYSWDSDRKQTEQEKLEAVFLPFFFQSAGNSGSHVDDYSAITHLWKKTKKQLAGLDQVEKKMAVYLLGRG